MAGCLPSLKKTSKTGHRVFTSSKLNLVENSIDKGSVSDLPIKIKKTPEPTGRVERKVGDNRMLLNLLKGMIGPGCLSLPLAFGFAGLWVGLALTACIGLLNTHCMGLLVSSAQHLCKKSEKSDLDYGHLAKKALEYGPSRLRRYNKIGLYVTNATVAIFQIGVCSVQIVFMASNLQKIVEEYAPEVEISIRQYQLMFFIPCLLACYMKNLKWMSYFSLIGNLTIMASLIIIFQYIVQTPNKYTTDDAWFITFDRLLLFLGSILYSFEGQAMILPMENEMKEPKHMNRRFGVLDTSMSLVTICYMACGFYGYLKFGSDVKGSITLNMPGEPLYQVVNILVILVVYLGLPLGFYVLYAMMWPSIKSTLPDKVVPYHVPLEYLFRTCNMLIAFVLAISIPNLSQIIPLIGISAGCTIALILPPIIHIFALWEEWNNEIPTWKRVLFISKDTAIALFGVFGLIAGLYANVLQLMGHVSLV